MNRYEKLADNIAQRIRAGSLKANDRLPSVRELKSQMGISASTVFSAYYLLEAQGLVEARQRSGYFVRAGAEMPANELAASEPVLRSMSVDVSSLVFQVLAQARERDMVPLGSAFPSPELFPFEQLAAGLTRALKRMDPWQTVEDLSPGNVQLRHQISLRYGSVGMDVPASELVITSGAMEALNLALESVTQPGDLVAIETPTFYGALQALERRGLRAVEVETHPRTGVDLDSLARVIDQHPVKACWFMPTFQNPMGCTMSDAAKEQLVSMLATRAIPLIEDDVYGELAHEAQETATSQGLGPGWLGAALQFFLEIPGTRISHRLGSGRSLCRHFGSQQVDELAGDGTPLATGVAGVPATQEFRSSPARPAAFAQPPAGCMLAIYRSILSNWNAGHAPRGWLFPVARAARRCRLARTAPERSSARHRRSAGPFVFSRPPIHPAPAHQLRISRRPALGRGYQESWRSRQRAA